MQLEISMGEELGEKYFKAAGTCIKAPKTKNKEKKTKEIGISSIIGSGSVSTRLIPIPLQPRSSVSQSPPTPTPNSDKPTLAFHAILTHNTLLKSVKVAAKF